LEIAEPSSGTSFASVLNWATEAVCECACVVCGLIIQSSNSNPAMIGRPVKGKLDPESDECQYPSGTICIYCIDMLQVQKPVGDMRNALTSVRTFLAWSRYWNGAVCKLLVTGNQMLCGVTFIYPSSINSSFFLSRNASLQTGQNLAGKRRATWGSSCMGEEDCKSLLGPC
jgi:hypothetical protein